MDNRKLEVCVDSLASARAAVAGGADRLELCSALSVGGLTPFTDLLRLIRRETDIEIRCMIRPRPGDFLYTPEELQLMLMQIIHLKEVGADGFVFGCLDQEGRPDEQALRWLMEAAQGKKVTFHRAIDVSADPVKTYEVAARLGFHTVLTSGGAANCTAGKATIGKLLELQKELNGPEVLIGAGVNAGVIAQFRKEFPEACAFHMSGKQDTESRMRFRKEGVPMGIPGLDEWHISQTSAENVRQARVALDA